MTTTSRLDRAIATHRQQNNVDIVLGYLKSPDGSGDPRLRDGSGRLWVSVQTAEGYSRPVALPVDTNANIPPNDNLSVEVGYIHGEQCVLRASRRGMLGAGTNPAVTNPADPDVRAGNQTVGESQFRCKRSADSSKPWTVVVETGYIEIDGFAYVFIESEIDLSGLVPSADEKVIACVYVRTDLTLEAFASSAVLPDDPITGDMINECRQQADPTSMSVWGWVLEGDLSGLTENPAKNIDLRKPAAPPVSSMTSTTLPNFGAGVVKTLVSGVVDAGDDRHLIIEAESGTTDTLTEITGLNVGDEVVIRADTGDTITIKDDDAGATDKLLLHNATDLPITGDQTLKLMKIEEGKVVQYVDEKGSGSGSGNIITVGTYAASRPSSPSEGDLYLPTDGRFTEVYHSSAWKFTDHGRVFVKPSSLSWSWVNQGSASISSTAGVEYLSTSTSAGGAQNLNIRKKAAPSAPYTVTVQLKVSQLQEAGSQFGVCFRESSSGKLAALLFYFASGSLPSIYAQNYTNPTTVSAAVANMTVASVPEWVRIEDNNTNRIMSYSYDGVTFTPFYTIGRTTFLTADEVGFFVNPFAIANQIDLTLLAWIEA